MAMAAAASSSATASRSAVASMALSKAAAKPRAVAVAAGSSGNDEPAIAPAPSGLTSARRPASWKRPTSLARAKPWAASWKAHSTGWAGWRWVSPGTTAVRAGGPAGPDQGVDQPGQGLDGVGAGLLEPQVQVGGDLVVAAAAGVELAPGRADQLGQAPLDRAVDVLVAVGEGEPAGSSSPATWARPSSRSLPSPDLQHPGPDQAAHMGPAPGHVLAPQPPVGGQRRGVGPHPRVGRPREPAGPERPGPARPVTHPRGPGPRCGRAGPTGTRTRARRRGRRRRRPRRWPGRAGTGPARPAGRSAGSARATAPGGPRR